MKTIFLVLFAALMTVILFEIPTLSIPFMIIIIVIILKGAEKNG